MPEAVTKAASWTKHAIWKYLGAMIMERKEGVQAISLHKTLGVVMFGWCLWQWSVQPADGYVAIDSDAVYTLWLLLGLKGVSKVMDRLKGTG